MIQVPVMFGAAVIASSAATMNLICPPARHRINTLLNQS
jgi:hypothetical protein